MTEDNEVLLKSFANVPVYMVLPTSSSRSISQGIDSVVQSPSSRQVEMSAGTGERISATDENRGGQRSRSSKNGIHLVYSRHE